MSDFQLTSKSSIKQNQLAFLAKQAKEVLGESASVLDIETYAQTAYTLYKTRAGEPLFFPRRAERYQLPFREDVLDNMEEIIADLNIIAAEHNTASKFLVDSFNIVHSEKKRLSSRIGSLNNLVGELSLLSGESGGNTTFFKESFQDNSALDTEYALSNVIKAHLSIEEGILTLGRKSTKNLSETASVAQVLGNGEAGTNHLTKKFVTTDKQGVEIESFHFLNQFEPEQNKDPAVLLDNRPDTIFEYQMVNVPTSFKNKFRNYNFEWSKSAPEDDILRLKIVVELKQEELLNWISLFPYYANNASTSITIYSIRTSADGFDYEPLYTDKQVLNQAINNTPQTYQLDALFDGSNVASEANYTGQGVWSFPQRKTRFIEFVIDQDQAYNEIIGQEVYTAKLNEMEIGVQVPAPEELKNAEPGEYTRTIDGQRVVYTKTIEATNEGWRYAIGIRDIQLMQYQFEEKSYFVSKRYHSAEELTRLVLYANEIIPESYLDIVSKNNDWVIYEVSFDDTNWFRVSPMHHEPLNDNFPAKIMELNGSEIDLAAAFQVHKTLVKTKEPIHDVRLKITITRPTTEGFENTTPIVEDVAIKVEKKGAAIS